MKQSINAQFVLNWLISKLGGAENSPVTLGNVNFWHPVPGFPVNLCYSVPTNNWDAAAVQNDLNKKIEPFWDEFVKDAEKQV